MSEKRQTFRSTIRLHPLLFVLLLIIPSGCYTSNLWSKHLVKTESSPQLVGTFDQFYVSTRDKKVCIRYKTATDRDQQYSLLINGAPDYKLDNAKDILQNNIEVNISSIIVNVQEYKPLTSPAEKKAVVYFSWRLPDENIAFVKDESGYASDTGMQAKYDQEIREAVKRKEYMQLAGIELSLPEQELVKKIIQDKWKENFGNDLDSVLYPIAWIDREGKVIVPSSEDLSTRLIAANDALGIVEELRPPTNGFRFVRLQYNVPKYTNFATHASFGPDEEPRALKNTSSDTYFFLFGAIASNGGLWYDKIVDTVTSKGNCSAHSPEWTLLSNKGIVSSIYSNVREEQRTFKYPLLMRVFGTPFTVFIDILTFPFQIYIITNYKPV